MKVLKDNYTQTDIKDNVNAIKPYPRELTCENCGSSLEYEKSDLRMGALGCIYLDCPLCKYENMIEDNEDSITLTVDNIEFPTHFFHTSVETGAVDVDNEKIKKYIRNAIDYFRKNKDAFSYEQQSGTLHIVVFRYDGDKNYEVVVSKDFYSTYIPFESEDYSF